MDINYEELDPGIRSTVKWLNDNGFETIDSGDGVTKLNEGWDPEEVAQFPHVFITVSPDILVQECKRLLALLKDRGIELNEVNPDNLASIEGSYDPVNNSGIIFLSHVVIND